MARGKGRSFSISQAHDGPGAEAPRSRCLSLIVEQCELTHVSASPLRPRVSWESMDPRIQTPCCTKIAISIWLHRPGVTRSEMRLRLSFVYCAGRAQGKHCRESLCKLTCAELLRRRSGNAKLRHGSGPGAFEGPVTSALASHTITHICVCRDLFLGGLMPLAGHLYTAKMHRSRAASISIS